MVRWPLTATQEKQAVSMMAAKPWCAASQSAVGLILKRVAFEDTLLFLVTFKVLPLVIR